MDLIHPDAKIIRDALLDCLPTDDEVKRIEPDDMITFLKGMGDTTLLDKYSLKVVNAIACSFNFHKGRLKKYRPMVIESIKNLKPAFSCLGESFYLLCLDKTGKEWGDHRNSDELIALALGLDMCELSNQKHRPTVRFKLPETSHAHI
jgi:hypothetical protein